MNNNLDTSIDLDAAVTAINAQRKDDGIGETPVVGSDWMNKLKDDATVSERPVVNDEPKIESLGETDAPNNDNVEVASEDTAYSGPGLVITKEEYDAATSKQEQTPKYTGITPDTQSYIDKYLEDMDNDIEEGKRLKAEHEAASTTDAESTQETTEEKDSDSEDDFTSKYESAVVIIDKTGFGNVINFTNEEREKLKKVKTIKLEEVETMSMETLKTKKLNKKTDFNHIIKKKADFNSTSIVLPVSGYTATISGCSAYELISLIEPADSNVLLKTQNKWSIIHSKIESTSIGKMDFDTFLKNTAAADYETFIYGILCSTYPDDDSVELICDQCEGTFTHNYSVRSLIRVEEMSDELQNNIMRIVDASVTEETAKEVHENAPISTVKRIKLPMSEIILDVYVQSAHDLIITRAKELSTLTDSKYERSSIIATVIRAAYVYDEEDESYFEITDGAELSQMVYALSEVDLMVINKVADELLQGKTIEYGLMNINCPHCKDHKDSLSIGLDEMLFQRYRQAIDTTVE